MTGREFGQSALGAVERMVDLVVMAETAAGRHGRDVPILVDYGAAMGQLYSAEHVARFAAAAMRAAPDRNSAGIAAASVTAAAWSQELAVVAAVIVYPLARVLAEQDGIPVGQVLTGLVDLTKGDPQ